MSYGDAYSGYRGLPPIEKKAAPPVNPKTACCGKFRSVRDVERIKDSWESPDHHFDWYCKPGHGCKQGEKA